MSLQDGDGGWDALCKFSSVMNTEAPVPSCKQGSHTAIGPGTIFGRHSVHAVARSGQEGDLLAPSTLLAIGWGKPDPRVTDSITSNENRVEIHEMRKHSR